MNTVVVATYCYNIIILSSTTFTIYGKHHRSARHQHNVQTTGIMLKIIVKRKIYRALAQNLVPVEHKNYWK